MIRLVVALAGLAVIGAVFAGIYYAPANLQVRETGAPAFQLAPGEAEQTTLQPTVPGTPILVQVQGFGGPIDVYVLEKEWADVLPDSGQLLLDRPFSYDATHSILGLNGTAEFTIVSDGVTSHVIVFDNSDNFYDGDTAPNVTSPSAGQASVQLTVRYVEEEGRSLVLGYIAATPSVLLVLLTLWRKIWGRKPPATPAPPPTSP